MSFSAFWLPAIPDVATRSWRAPEPGSATLLVPELTPELIRAQADALIRAGESLGERSGESIVRSIGAVAERFLDPRDPLRGEALELLPAVTGMSREMAELVLGRMAGDWRGDALARLVVAEFGDIRVLDGFAPASGRRTHVVGPKLLFHLFSGNVPGVAVTSLIRGLLVKAPGLGKTASGEPVLPVLFARALAEEDAGLGEALAVAYWPGSEGRLLDAAMERSDCVVAYGSRGTIAALRERIPPGSRLVEHGSRVSVGLATRETLSEAGADGVARDAAMAVATFDQQGCVSPHVIYVERGGEVSPEAWAERLARELAALEQTLPRGAITAAEASAIQQLRGRAEVRALAEPGNVLHASAGGTAWTVIVSANPAFEASCLQRTVWVKPIDDIEELPTLLRPLGSELQTVGVSAGGPRVEDLAVELARIGVTRVARLNEMAWPPPTWHHDGRPPLGELVRFCDLE